jgi:O-antigen ligase
MTATLLTAAPVDARVVRRPSLLQVLVVGGSAVAPLNLLLVKSLTVYDVLIGWAALLLLHQRRLQMPPPRYLVAVYVFLLAAVLSAFRATYPIEALTQVAQYFFIFLVLVPVVLSVVRTRAEVLTSIALMALGSLGAIVHAYFAQNTQGAGRVLVFYSDNPNRLGYPAAYLVPMILALWLCTRGLRRAHRLLAGAGCVAGLYFVLWALGASASRSSLLGTLVALIVFVVLRPRLGFLRMLMRTTVLVGGVILLGLLLVRSGQLPTTLEERITRSFTADSDDQSNLVGDREHLANAGLRAFVDSPFLGTGLDNFRYVAVDYDLDATPQNPHNVWLQLLAQIGAFGTLAVATALVMWLRDMIRAYRHALAPDGTLIWGLVAGLGGIFTILLFAPEMVDRHYWLIFALGLALVDGVRRHNQRQVTPS